MYCTTRGPSGIQYSYSYNPLVQAGQGLIKPRPRHGYCNACNISLQYIKLAIYSLHAGIKYCTSTRTRQTLYSYGNQVMRTVLPVPQKHGNIRTWNIRHLASATKTAPQNSGSTRTSTSTNSISRETDGLRKPAGLGYIPEHYTCLRWDFRVRACVGTLGFRFWVLGFGSTTHDLPPGMIDLLVRVLVIYYARTVHVGVLLAAVTVPPPQVRIQYWDVSENLMYRRSRSWSP